MTTTTLLASLFITLGVGLITGAAIELLRVIQRVGDGRTGEPYRLRWVVVIAALVSLGTLPLVLLGKLSSDAINLAVGLVVLLGATVVIVGVRATSRVIHELLTRAAARPSEDVERDAAASAPFSEDESTQDGRAQATLEAPREQLSASDSASDASASISASNNTTSASSSSRLTSIMNSESGVFQGGEEALAVGPGRVMIVDDSAVNRAILRRHLVHLGHEATQCVDGGQALEMLERDPHFDVVLLDLVMPGVDGFEVLRRIKSSDRLSEIPVLIISSVQDAEQVARCIEAGAADFLSKSALAA